MCKGVRVERGGEAAVLKFDSWRDQAPFCASRLSQLRGFGVRSPHENSNQENWRGLLF